jgi:hypothetical protein
MGKHWDRENGKTLFALSVAVLIVGGALLSACAVGPTYTAYTGNPYNPDRVYPNPYDPGYGGSSPYAMRSNW